MGGRGAFIDPGSGNFSFKENGQTFVSVGEIDGIKILVRKDGLSVKAPEFSHTGNRIYAIIQDGNLKHIAFYDENHKQVKCIDLMHVHQGMCPHYHLNLDHSNAYPLTPEDQKIISKIKRRFC